MKDDAKDRICLVDIAFPDNDSRVKYMDDFKVIISGELWQRQFMAAMKMIDLYQEEDKVSRGKKQ